MSPEFKKLIHQLEIKQWLITQDYYNQPFPYNIQRRYPWIPEEVKSVISELKEVIRNDNKLWLLTAADYLGKSDSAFAWNEWELQSIEAAGDDEQWVSQIRQFWDYHMPIALSIEDGYAYYAIKPDLTVVYGREPEFEETTSIALNFADFLNYLVK